MAVLSSDLRKEVAREFGEKAFRNSVAHSNFTELLEAVSSLDDWIEPRATEFVGSLPTSFVKKASVQQLQDLFLIIVRKRLS